MTRIAIALGLVAASIVAPACSKPADEEAGGDGIVEVEVEVDEQKIADKRQEMAERLRARLDQLDRKTAGLRERAAELGGEAADKAREAIGPLDERRAQLARQLDRVREASADELDQIDDALGSAVDDLESKYNELLERMRTD